MRGRVTDVLGGTIQRAALNDSPSNRYVTQDNMLGFVDVAIGSNYKAYLPQVRNVPVLVMPQNTGYTFTDIVGQDEQVFGNGGLANIPAAGIWRKIVGRNDNG